jgi:hypothetical protein
VERTRRVGVLGTLVWDRIWLHGASLPREGWGGIAYSLAAWATACPPGWAVVPLVKLGRDLEAQARELLAELPRLASASERVVPETSNRVDLRYTDSEHRGERLVGGVLPWTWEELALAVSDLDALYVNFITGDEMHLADAERLREGFRGPIYADLHSLLLGHGPTGHRFAKPLAEWERWVACFDAVQTNYGELATQAESAGQDPWSFARYCLGCGPALFVVTLGTGGAAYAMSDGASSDPSSWRVRGAASARPRTGRVSLPGRPATGDPTGCGDVWGSTFFAELLAGAELEPAMASAHRAAALKMVHSGASGLYMHLAEGSFPA